VTFDQGADKQQEKVPMSKANDLEGRQDMGRKHGGQAGMPKLD
jgi:hypothetical protein